TAPSEGRRWAEEVLRLPDAAAPSAERAAALSTLGALVHIQGDHVGARQRLEESVDLWRALGHRPGLAYALAHLGWSSFPDPAAAQRALGESIGIAREVGKPWELAMALQLR